MKGLKMQSVTLCMVLAPMPALADIQSLNDTEMGRVTGQAGVTIELDTVIDIGEFKYVDNGNEVTVGSRDPLSTTASIYDGLQTLTPGGNGITIDLETRIDIAQFRYIQNPGGGVFGINNISIGGTDRDDHFAELGNVLNSAPSDLLDDIRMKIDVLDDGDALIDISSQTGGPIDIGIRTDEWALWGSTDSTVVMDYFYMDALLEGANILVDTESDVLAIGAGLAVSQMEFDADFISLGIRGLRITGANYNPADPNADDLYADVGLLVYRGQRADGGEALAIDMPRFDADVEIAGVLLGGTSIGGVLLDNLSITNTAIRVYGR